MQQMETFCVRMQSHESERSEETQRGSGEAGRSVWAWPGSNALLSRCPCGKTVRQTQATLFELGLAPRSQTRCLLLRTKTDHTEVVSSVSHSHIKKNHISGSSWQQQKVPCLFTLFSLLTGLRGHLHAILYTFPKRQWVKLEHYDQQLSMKLTSTRDIFIVIHDIYSALCSLSTIVCLCVEERTVFYCIHVVTVEPFCSLAQVFPSQHLLPNKASVKRI